MTPHTPFSSIEEGIAEIAAGRMLVVVDDEDRENEGDLLMAAEMVTPEAVNFMITHARGLVCLPLTGQRLSESGSGGSFNPAREYLHAGTRLPSPGTPGRRSGARRPH
jgi:hypothetical protein